MQVSPSFPTIARKSLVAMPAVAPGPAPASVAAKVAPAPVAIQDLSAAIGWTAKSGAISGTQANITVTDTYNQLDQAMTAYMGQPTIANWCTFGKYASANVGKQLRQLEDALNVLAGHPFAFLRLWRDGGYFHGLKPSISFLGAILSQFESGVGKTWNPLAQLRLPPEAKTDITALRDALTRGNVGIYANIAPAFNCYLQAANAGKDGVAALQRMGYGKAPLDPQGFVLKGFQCYQKAHDLGVQAATSGVSAARRRSLLAQRAQLMNQGNLYLGAQEQFTILQSPQIYDDPRVAALVNGCGAVLQIQDASGTHKLLPYGGAWTDFATRMGLSEVPLGSSSSALVVQDESGTPHAYVIASGAQYDGTIAQYFAENLTPSASTLLIQGSPWHAIGARAA